MPQDTTPRIDAETFRKLVAEGQELRKAFDLATRPMRVFTAEDLARRCR